MEKANMYPEMPAYQQMPNAPPNYNQSTATAPSSEINGMMPTSIPGPMYGQVHQQQHTFPQPQPVMVQSIPQIPPLGPHPCLVTCPSCHQQRMSNIRLESSSKTHLFALALCVVGLCCCSCIPYCVDSCKNANHYCSNCDAYLGVYNK